MLLHEAIGDQLTCVFVDHGLLQAGEGDKVVALFRNSYNIPLVQSYRAPSADIAAASSVAGDIVSHQQRQP